MLIDFREWGREREGERNIDVREKHPLVTSHTCPDRGWNPQLGMCPDLELNPQHFGVQDDAPTN